MLRGVTEKFSAVNDSFDFPSPDNGFFGRLASLCPRLEFLTARNGSVTARDGGVPLHSLYDPEREAGQGVAGKNPSRPSAVFFGFGLGYHAAAWSRLHPSGRLVLVEPDPARFFAALSVVDWTSVFSLKNLVIAVSCPVSSVLALIENSAVPGEAAFSGAWFLDLPRFTGHSDGYFSELRILAARNGEKDRINRATLDRFSGLWLRNSSRNAARIADCPGISGLKSRFPPEIPFLVVAAGPSLSGILPHIRSLAGRMIIVCVETALRALLHEGVQPDFIVISDPQFWAYRHIAGLSSPGSVLVTDISVVPAVFRFDCRRIMLCRSEFPVGRFFGRIFPSSGALGSGGSVASAAWSLAVWCGAERIYLAGLDLGFPGGQTHVRGSTAEQRFHSVSSRVSPSEKSAVSVAFSAGAETASSYDGGTVLTDRRMRMFAWWFESHVAAQDGRSRTFTLCPEGLAVPGIETASVDSLLSAGKITEFRRSRMDSLISECVPSAGRDGFIMAAAEFLECAERIAGIAEAAVRSGDAAAMDHAAEKALESPLSGSASFAGITAEFRSCPDDEKSRMLSRLSEQLRLCSVNMRLSVSGRI